MTDQVVDWQDGLPSRRLCNQGINPGEAKKAVDIARPRSIMAMYPQKRHHPHGRKRKRLMSAKSIAVFATLIALVAASTPLLAQNAVIFTQQDKVTEFAVDPTKMPPTGAGLLVGVARGLINGPTIINFSFAFTGQ